MATRAEQYRMMEQRKVPKPKRPGRAGKPAAGKRATKAAGKKATYALEAPREGRPSRKSTRKSANRSKPDTNLTLRAARAKGSPEAKARKARARAVKVRGHSRTP